MEIVIVVEEAIIEVVTVIIPWKKHF